MQIVKPVLVTPADDYFFLDIPTHGLPVPATAG
jgi:hypothetical protein